MQKLLIVCGPTATGKTDLAIFLAKKFNGEIVSADSRQVYKGLDIGTGKDLPKNAHLIQSNIPAVGFYEIESVKVWGYDLVDAKQKFSVSQYQNKISKVITDIIKRDKLPIVVGGTGLYIKALVDGIETLEVAQNPDLRKTLEDKTAAQLFDILAQFDAIKAANMNESDRHNPRRLVRAIEVASSGFKGSKNKDTQYSPLFIGLTAPHEYLGSQIKKRVQKRVEQGIEDEIENLLKQGVVWTDQSMSSLGYQEWQGSLGNKGELENVLKIWCQNEMNYAKRQMVWFKKDKRINWFDVSKLNYHENVEKMVKKWYAS